MQLSKDVWEQSQFFFAPQSYEEKTLRKKWKEKTPSIMQELSCLLEKMEDFSAEKLKFHSKPFYLKKNLVWAVLLNFRLAVTGLGTGPSMFQISALLGKEEVVDRIQTAIENIQQ